MPGPVTHIVIHSASCILMTAESPRRWLPLHYPVEFGCPFTTQAAFVRSGSALGRPMFVCLWQNPNLRPALPDRLAFPSHQAIHLPTKISLTTPLEILHRNLDNPSRCRRDCLAFCFAFVVVFPAPIILHNIASLHITWILHLLGLCSLFDSSPRFLGELRT